MYTEEELYEDCERIASRFSKIKAIEIAGIWDVICRYIENQLKNGKACSLIGLGKFTFLSKKIDGGTMGIKEQRTPVFVMNESFLRLHGLKYSKQYITSEVSYSGFVIVAFLDLEHLLTEPIIIDPCGRSKLFSGGSKSFNYEGNSQQCTKNFI